jgi:hypothetical protein
VLGAVDNDSYFANNNEQSIELAHVSSSHWQSDAMTANQKQEFVYDVRFRVLTKGFYPEFDKLSMVASVFSFRLGRTIKKRKNGMSENRREETTITTDDIILGVINRGGKGDNNNDSSSINKEKGEVFVSFIFAGDRYRQLLDEYFKQGEGQVVSARYVCNVLLHQRLFLTCAAKPGPACMCLLLGDHSTQTVTVTENMVVEQAKHADDKTSCALELAKQVDCWAQLNLRQKDSIVYCMNNVLQNTGSLSLVQGPPGCGKTRFIVALLKTLLLKQRQLKKKKKSRVNKGVKLIITLCGKI